MTTERVYASVLIDPITHEGYPDATQAALNAALTEQVAGRREVEPRHWHIATEGARVRLGVAVAVEVAQ